jgi:transposase
VKTLEQQALTSLHRLRSAYVADRTARINCVRGILREFGHAIPQGSRTFVARARAVLDDGSVPTDLALELGRALDEIAAFRQTIVELTKKIERIGEEILAVEHLRTVPGIGVLTATALVEDTTAVDLRLPHLLPNQGEESRYTLLRDDHVR